MKITILINDITPAAGTERITSMISNVFVRNGHDVTVISCYKEFDKIAYGLDEHVKIVYINSGERKRNRLLSLAGHIRQIYKVRKELAKIQSDFIIGQGFAMSFILFFCGRIKQTVSCEHIYSQYYSFPVRIVRNFIYRFSYHVVVLTEKDKFYFKRWLKNVKVIPNINTFYSESKADLSQKRIISVGRLEKQKRFDHLICAVKRVFEIHTDWVLNIYGEGGEYNNLKKLISDLSLEKNVFLCGKTMDIKEKYLNSSIYVMSSKFEGFGLVLVEAAACGLPVISYDCPNGPHDILSPDLGVLIENGNREELQNAILNLIEMEDMRRLYSLKGSQITDRYSESKIYKLWEELFTSINN